MANPCVVIDKRTGKQYTIPEFAAELNKGMLKDLIDNKIIDNTKFERGSRLELFNASAPTSEVMQETIADIAPKTLKSITDFLQKQGIKAEIILAESQEAFEKYVREHGGTREDYANKGYYVTKKMGETKEGTIVVNLTKATSETLFHEVGHPFTDVIEATNPERIDTLVEGIGKIEGGQEFIKAAEILYATEEKALPFLREALKKAEEAGDTEKATAIKEKIASIEKDVAQQKKEIIVDFIARVADGTFEVNRNNFEKVRDYLIEFLNSFGIDIGKDYLDQKAVIELSQKLSEKFYSGEAITAEDLGLVELKTEQGEPSGEFAFQSSKSTVSKKVSKNPMYFENLKKFANESSFKNKLEFKKALEKSLKDKLPELKKIYGEDFDPTVYNETTKKYLSDILTQEAVNAIAEHPEAIGWYDAKTQSALTVIGLIHPEILTDAGARGAFITPLAIMSNGNKVDFNFDLAERQYTYFKKNGRFNPEGEYGAQQVGIRKSLKLINSLLDNGLTMEDINTFFTSKYKAGDLSVRVKNTKGELKLKSLATGELKGEQVYGAVVLGSKIGNGFYMNLWGEFGQLTMDRWFMRTWGRLTGTLIEDNPTKIENNKKTLTDALNTVKKDKKATAILNEALGDVSKMSLIELANFIEKKSADKKVRAILEGNSKTQELKNAGNNLAKNIRGEKEAPSNGTERVFIRDVFNDVSKRLKKEYNIDITMADLQAVLWYPEKILYESFKEGESFEEASEGYTEDSAPDYLNAAKKIAKKNGITDEQINQTLSDRTDSTGSIQRGRDTGGGEAVSTDNKTILEKFKESLGHKELEPKTKVKNQTTLQFSKSEVGEKLKDNKEESVDKEYEYIEEEMSWQDRKWISKRVQSKNGYAIINFSDRMFDPRTYEKYSLGDNKVMSVGRLDAAERGKGQGYEVLKQVIDNAKSKDVIAIDEASNNQYATATYQRAVDNGLLIPFNKGLDGKDIGWLIKSDKLSELYNEAINTSESQRTEEQTSLIAAVDKAFGTEAETTLQASRSEVYHGGDIVDLNSLKKDEPFFVTEDQAEAIAYASGNDGYVSIAKIDLSKIADEEVARNILEKMGFSKDEYMLHELIDPRFKESYIGKKNVEKLYAEIKSQGYDGIKFTDSSITNKRTADNIVLISPKETLADSGLGSSRIVGEMKAEELFTQGYKPVIDGKILENATEADFDKHFTTNETITMVKESPTTSKLQASRSEVGKTVEETAERLKEVVSPQGEGKEYAYYLTDNGLQIRDRDYKFNLMNEIFDKVGARKYASLVRKYIDPTFSKETLGYSNRPFADHLNDMLHELSRDYNIEQIRDLAKGADIKIDLPAPSKDNIRFSDSYIKSVAKKYHEGTNPSVTKAVETLLGTEGETTIQASRSEVNRLPSDTSIKNASISQDLIARGQPDLVKKAKQTHQQSWDMAMDRIDKGFNVKELIQEIITNPRPISVVEGAMLAYDRLNIKYDYNKKVDQINEAIINNDTELVSKLNKELEAINQQLNENDQASNYAGTEWGRSGAFRREVYSLDMTAETIEKQWRAAKNEDLTTEERAKAEAAAKKFDEAQAALDKHLEEKRQKELEAEIKKQEAAEKKALKEIQQDLTKKPLPKESINKYRNSLFSKLNDLYNEPKDNIQRSKSKVGKTKEEQVKEIIKELAKTYFAEGMRDMQEIVDAVHNDLKQFDNTIENRQVRDAISGYDSTPKPKFSEVKSEMDDIIKQMKMVSEIEDFYKKNPEAKRPTVAPKSESVVKLENQLAELKQVQKLFDELQQLETEGLSAKTPKEKKQVSQDIQDLQQMIAEKKKELRLKEQIEQVEQGKLPEQTTKEERALSPELQKLQDDLNNKTKLLKLSNELEQLNSEGLPTPKTPKEREQVSKEVADLEKQIADKKKELKYKAQIEDLNQGKLPTKTEKEIEELSPELKALKDEYEKKKKMLQLANELESLEQNGLPAPKTPEAKAAVDQEIQDINKKIADKKKELRLKGLISDVDQGKLPEKGKPREQLSAELQALQDEYNKKKRLLEKQKEYEEFKRYGSKTPTTRKEVDADIQAIQDKINEGKRIEALLKRLFELDNLENHLKALEDQVQELRDKANETGDETYNDLANDIEQQIKDKLDENQKRGKERKPKSDKQKEYEKKIREKEKQLGLDEESKLKAANAQLQKRLDELREMLRTGNVEKPKVEDVIDPRDKKLLAEVEKAKLEVEMERERLRRERMSGSEKVRDWFDKLMRAMVLSGGTIIGKLPAAGFARTFISKPIESLLAPGISPLSKRAPSEGKINRKAQLKAMSEWLEGNNWLIDFAESIKQSKVVLGEEFMNVLKGQGELDMLYGSKKYALDDSRLEWIGRFHAALKNPTKRAEWNRSYIKRLEHAIENGEDVSNQEVHFRIQSEAYADAMRSIFMQDNLISNGYTNFLHTLENNKYAPAPGKLLSSLLQILIPVVKIPTNYVAETGQYIPLLGAYRAVGPLINILRHGVESITPEQADYLVRVGKKQGVGAMILAFGYMNADNIGGYYQKGENRETEDVKAGEIKIMGKHIPHWLLHSPLFEVMMMGATIKRIQDKELMKGENISWTAGLKEGLFASVLGLGEQIPQTSPIQGIYRASQNTEGSNKYVGEIAARMIIPQIVKDVAKWTDVETPEGEGVKRSPKTFLDNFKVNIPGLRGNVTMNTKDYVAINLSNQEYDKLVSTGAIDALKPYTNRKFQTLDTPPKTYYMSLEELAQFNEKRNQLLAVQIKNFINDPRIKGLIETEEQYKTAVGYVQRSVDKIVLQMMNLDDLDELTKIEAEKRILMNQNQ